MPSCPSCGKDVGDGAAFCGYCGAGATGPGPCAAQEVGTAQPPLEYWVCPSCSIENLADDAFCGSCGSARRPASPVTSAPVAPARPPASAPRTVVAQARPGRASRRRWVPVLVIIIVVIAAGIVAVAVARRDGSSGASGSGAGAVSTPEAPATVTATQSTVTPSPSGSDTGPGVPRTWAGISSRPQTPFWGAFYCAGSNKKKAIEAAQVGHDAGWRTLVLWTGDYGGIGTPGDEKWVICAGPYPSRSKAQSAVDDMGARAGELRTLAPELDIHFGAAYVKLVE
jgi:hypothetical protein